jgi:type II secretory pathway component PulK
MTSRPSSQSPRASAPTGERGVVLILAVFAVVLLAVLTVAIAAAVRVELRASRTSLERMQALFLAEAGMRRARALLLYDDPLVDTLRDSWGPEAGLPLDLPQALGEGFYRVRVHDGCGRIDVNVADVLTLARLIGDPQAAAAIVSWREQTYVPEDAYYQSLPYPYQSRRGPFQTLGELLLVRGVTPAIFFGADGRPGLADLCTVEAISPNTDRNGSLRVGLNEFRNWSEEAFRASLMARLGSVLTMYDANQIFNGLALLSETGQAYTSLAQLATVAGLGYDKIVQVIDYFTAWPGLTIRGLVNVNTAPPEVLAALPGGSSDLALAIVVEREKTPFPSLGEFTAFLLNQPNGPDTFAQMIDRVNCKSSSYLIEAMGYQATGRTFRTLRALVRRSPEEVLVLQQAEQDWPLPSGEPLQTAAVRRSAFAAAQPAG